MKKALTFQDVLLVPQKSAINSRSEVETKVTIGNNVFNSPMIVANMRDLVGEKMLLANAKNRNLCFLHRFMTFEEQINILKKTKKECPNAYKYVGVSLGVKNDDKNNLLAFYEEGIRLYVIDIAHGHSDMCLNMIKYIKSQFPDVTLVAGNVATGNGAVDLWSAGADVVKVGIGSGSICSTRLMAGVGVPQLTAIMNIAHARTISNIKNKYIISDGGIRKPGDVTKALCFADMVMAGNLFSGSVDAPGNIVTLNSGEHLKEYHGSSTHKSKNIEGFKGLVDLKPEFSEILEEIMQGVRSGCSYVGCNNLKDLQDNPELVEITNSGVVESGAHDIKL